MIKDGIQGASLGPSSSPNCSLKRRRCRTLLLRRPECPPGLFAAVPAAGPSHASTYRPLKTTASSTSCCPAPTTSAATAMVPARPISDAATITPRPELPIRGELFQRTRIAQSNQSVSSTDTLTNRKGSQVSPLSNPQRRLCRSPRQELAQTKPRGRFAREPD